MPSPFPGMDPYLENPALWPGLHQLLIAHILGALNSALPQKYVANINERVYVLQSARDIYPDVAVLEHPYPAASAAQAGAVAVAPVGDPPLVLQVEAVEVHESFVEILPVADQSRVVAILEVLSPSNKEGGTGRDLYLTKQREALRSQAHLLEIDLLRGGQHTVAAPLDHLLLHGAWYSLVCLHRASQGPRYEFWPTPLEHRLPRVRVALSDGDPDVLLDLQDLFSRCYDQAAYRRRINYNEEPPVRLAPAAAQWVEAVLRGRPATTTDRSVNVNPEWRTRYEAAVEAARGAGRLALRYSEQAQLKVEWKHDDSPVTVADREAEQLLRQTIHGAFPQDGFLGEEYGDTPGSSGFRWVLDPIDGTRNFVRGIPIWATLVGLEYKGEPIAGVAEAPALRTTWRALRCDGAYRGDRRIRVSEEADLAKSLMFYSSLSWFLKAGKQDVFLELTRKTERQRGFGDFYGHVLVAEGAGEIMMEHGVHAWDVAALWPIVEEAGGRMTDWDGGWDGQRPDVIASNGKRHGDVLAILAGRRG